MLLYLVPKVTSRAMLLCFVLRLTNRVMLLLYLVPRLTSRMIAVILGS